MDTNTQIQQLQEQINKLKSDFDQLTQNFYKNNFSSEQIFNKSSNFTTRLKVPNYTTLPVAQVGEIAEVGGVLHICTVGGDPSTWTIVGTQS